MSAPLDRRADARYLREVAYAEPTGLTTRAALYAHQQPRIDLVTEALVELDGLAGCDVIDVGCGNGRYLAALHATGARVVGVDLSAGMLAAVPAPRPPVVAADAQTLPIAAEAFDAVLMMHMLYHLSDPERGLSEAQRILRPSGRLLVATNGSEHLAEMNELWLPLLDALEVRGDLEEIGLVNARLTADSLRRLVAGRFERFTERSLRSAVVVADPGPVLRHAATTTGSHVIGEAREELLVRFGEQVNACIRRNGEFRITTEVVFFLAEKS
jgi:SAM-dependent methyltransferase